MKRILLLIDCQFDFVSPQGALYVNNAREAMDNLAKYILSCNDKYNQIVATLDWHPMTHMSFKENGGAWPAHCVQYSMGASFDSAILQAAKEANRDILFLTKGTNEDREEYSVFRNIRSKEILSSLLDGTQCTVDVAGVALDFCVKDTLIDAKRELPRVSFQLLRNYSPAIGNADETLKRLSTNNIKII